MGMHHYAQQLLYLIHIVALLIYYILFSVFLIQSPSVTQAGLKIPMYLTLVKTVLIQPLQCWDYRGEPLDLPIYYF